MTPSSRNREALSIEQLLDTKYRQDVVPSVQTLTARALRWSEGAELGFPVAQDIRLDPGKPGYLSDLEVQLLRDFVGALKERD
jgi:hypothetical protein